MSPLVADGLRAVVARLPVEETIALIGGAGAFRRRGRRDRRSLLDQAGDLLP